MGDGRCGNAHSRRILTRLASNPARISATRTMVGAVAEVGAAAVIKTETTKGVAVVAEVVATAKMTTAVAITEEDSAVEATTKVGVVAGEAAIIKGEGTGVEEVAMVGTTVAGRIPTKEVIARQAIHSPMQNASSSSVKIRFES